MRSPGAGGPGARPGHPERGSATAEIAVAFPVVVLLLLFGLTAVGATIDAVRRLERDDAVLFRSKLPSSTETWIFRLAPWPSGRLEALR